MIYTHPKEEFNIIICHYLFFFFGRHMSYAAHLVGFYLQFVAD